MAEWLYEEGIGENRAILVESGSILETGIEWPDELRVGAVAAGRLSVILVPGRRGIIATRAGDEILVEPLPPSLSQGRTTRVEIVREPIAEPGRGKIAKGRITDAPEREGPSLAERIAPFTRLLAHDPDRFEEAGWSELLEEAISGEIPFAGGALRMSLTPAMTLFDVDGSLPDRLAIAGAEAAARTIRRFGIGGSIGIDLPTLAGRTERLRAAAAFDAILPQPFERTAVNGFGFLQVIRPRPRASLPERLCGDPAGAAVRALLRRAERDKGTGARTLAAAPAVVARLEQNPAWIMELERRLGASVRLQAEPAFTTFAFDVRSAHAS